MPVFYVIVIIKIMEKTEITWSAPEYEQTKKSSEWFWALGILILALAVAAFLLKNILFVGFILLAGFTIALYAAKRPRVIEFSVSARGIQVDDRVYPYESLKSFWINYKPPRKKEVEVISKKVFMSRLILPLGEADPNEIRGILGRVLKEEEPKDSITDIVAERLGF